MKNVIVVIDMQAQNIEQEKLRAIGFRNRVKSEAEVRKRSLQEYQQIIAEKQNELERYTMELESLIKVEAEQKKLIQRLSNSEPEHNKDDDEHTSAW